MLGSPYLTHFPFTILANFFVLPGEHDRLRERVFFFLLRELDFFLRRERDFFLTRRERARPPALTDDLFLRVFLLRLLLLVLFVLLAVLRRLLVVLLRLLLLRLFFLHDPLVYALVPGTRS